MKKRIMQHFTLFPVSFGRCCFKQGMDAGEISQLRFRRQNKKFKWSKTYYIHTNEEFSS